MIGLGELMLLAVVGPVGLAGMAFWVWMIVDCATKETATGNDRVVWILVIVLGGWIGALVYFFVRRPRRVRGASGSS